MKKNLLRLIIIGFAACALFSGCTSKEVKKAKQFIDASMYDQAISLLEIEIQANPKNAEASYLLGKCYLQTSNYNKVNDCFKRAILLKTDYKKDIGNIYFTKSLELFKSDDTRYANSYYEEGLKYNPIGKENFAKQLYDYVNDYSQSATEPTKSLNLFNVVIQVSPSYKADVAEKTFVLAKLFIGRGFANEGFSYADFCINNDPRHIKDVAELYFNYGNDLLIRQDRPNECIFYFDRCMVLDPSRRAEVGNIYYNQAKTYEARNRISLLLVFAKKSAEINNDYNSWYTRLKDRYQETLSETVTDIEGNVYNVISIGTQVWMKENLKTTKYNDGNDIPYVPNGWPGLDTPAYCWQNNNESTNKAIYGAIYNWHTVNSGKLCPSGWHVPTDAEWTVLTTFLGGESIAGGKLKETGTAHWSSPNTGATNQSGFSARAGGSRTGEYGYETGFSSAVSTGINGLWWSSSIISGNRVWRRYMTNTNTIVNRDFSYKFDGLSVRCIKNN